MTDQELEQKIVTAWYDLRGTIDYNGILSHYHIERKKQ